MRFFKRPFLFSLGGGLYGMIELLWRGRTHITMILLGGFCFLLLGKIRCYRISWPVKTLLGACAITCAELGTGLLANRAYTIWDYRHVPFNFIGQICLPYFLLWLPLSFVGMRLYGWAEQKIGSFPLFV